MMTGRWARAATRRTWDGFLTVTALRPERRFRSARDRTDLSRAHAEIGSFRLRCAHAALPRRPDTITWKPVAAARLASAVRNRGGSFGSTASALMPLARRRLSLATPSRRAT